MSPRTTTATQTAREIAIEARQKEIKAQLRFTSVMDTFGLELQLDAKGVLTPQQCRMIVATSGGDNIWVGPELFLHFKIRGHLGSDNGERLIRNAKQDFTDTIVKIVINDEFGE